VAGSEFDHFCRNAFRFLEEADVPYLVIGGLAVIVLGEPRTTGDADVIAFLTLEEAEALILRARDAGFDLDEDQEAERLRQTGTLCLRQSPFHLDLILASLPFENEALRRARPRKLFGVAMPFPTPEDLLLFKVLAGRDKDLLDAQGVLRRHKGKLDLGYVEETLRSICDLAEEMAPWAHWMECLQKTGLARGGDG
jgi:hypothetical protein